MGKIASVKYRSLRSNLVNLPLSLYAQLGQQQARPQSMILHIDPLSAPTAQSRSPKSVYLGWSGMNAAATVSQVEGPETVEVDPEVARSLGWDEGMLVEIGLIRDPVIAKSVSVTPLTPDDWEILEQHASFIENNLLSQLRAAEIGRVIDVWVMGKTKIRIRVDDTNPTTGPNSAVLIKADTEIFVAPRPRSTSSANGNGKLSSFPAPISHEGPLSPGNFKSRGTSTTLRLIPPRIASSWGQYIPSPEIRTKVEDGKIALCSPHIYSYVRQKAGVSLEEVISVSILLQEPEQEQLPPGPMIAAPQDAEKQPGKKSQVVLSSWAAMPDGCVVIAGKTQKWEERWGTVRIEVGPAVINKKKKKGQSMAVRDLSFPHPEDSELLPGLDTIFDRAIGYLTRTSMCEQWQAKPLLLLGARGSGKTSLVQKIGEKLGRDQDVLAETIYQDVENLDPESRIAVIRENMENWLEIASEKAPCCLILDGLDNLLPPETELKTSTNPSILADHFTRLFSASSIPPGVLVVATATDSSSLHPLLNIRHVFGETVKIPPLSKEVRQQVLKMLVRDKFGGKGEKIKEKELDYVLLGNMTEGYSVEDLSDLVGGAVHQAVIRGIKSGDDDIQLAIGDFELAHQEFTPLSLRGAGLQGSDVKWSDIGGLVEPRRILRETLEWPTKYAQIFANCPLRLRSGLLLYGFPGCGKTLLASAVAKECGLNFISVKGPEILNKYIGASEKSVRDLFERASGAKPCVLFFDEFDSIAPKRGHDSTGVTDRVVNQLLTEMDGAQGLSGVYVLAATSRPDLLDPALLRPGRLDKSILCPIPTLSDRLDILKAVVKTGSLEVDDGVDWEWVARQTEGYSGADLRGVVFGAHLEAVHGAFEKEHRDDDAKQEKGVAVMKGGSKRGEFEQVAPEGVSGDRESAERQGNMKNRIEAIVSNGNMRDMGPEVDGKMRGEQSYKPIIKKNHVVTSLIETRPSVAPADRKRLEAIYQLFVNERDGKMGNGDLGRETGSRMSLM